MSTRANVHVTQTGTGWEETVQLYHHCDGYPTNMLPLMASHKAEGWKAGRAGKLAAFIIATDPGGFEPEKDLRLHGDIEYFYRITTQNNNGGSSKEKPEILVEVFAVGDSNFEKFWDTGDPKLLKKLAGPLPLAKAAKQAAKIEALG